MAIPDLLIALLVGILQGIFEWLPISSEGNLTILLTALGSAPEQAVRYSLFLHLGTATAATAYFRNEIQELIRTMPGIGTDWWENTEFWFLGIGTVVSGVVGVAAYAIMIEAVSKLEGALLVVLIGFLLIITGLFQRLSSPDPTKANRDLSLWDAILVGLGQGVSVLPGVSRSGTTVGILLLRGYPGPVSFRLSFLLSIPAALGAGVLVLTESGGFGGISVMEGAISLLASGFVGYLTIDVLMRLVERISFWLICVVLGGLAVVGGGIIWL